MTLLTFGQFLQMKREAMGLSKTEVSKKMDISINNYSLYERDMSRPHPKTITKLTQFYKITEEEMIPYIDSISYMGSGIQSKPQDKPIFGLLRSINKTKNFIDQYMTGESSFEVGIKSRALKQLEVFELEIQKLQLIDDAFCNAF